MPPELPKITPPTTFKWSANSERAAVLVAEDELNDDEIAGEARVVRKTLYNWRQHPEFQAKVDELIDELARRARRRAIARADKRLEGYEARRQKMLALIDARSAGPDLQRAPGGETGTLTGHLKRVELEYRRRRWSARPRTADRR